MLAIVVLAAVLVPGMTGGSHASAGVGLPHGVQAFQGGSKYKWIAPEGVTSVLVELWGGGGGGGCAGGTDGKGGGGGGAGGYIRTFLDVTPGEPLVLTVAATAPGCGGALLAQDGGSTQVKLGASVLAMASGGRAGTNGTATQQGQGGSGGNPSIAALSVGFSGYPGHNAFGLGFGGDGGDATMGSVGRAVAGWGGAGGGRTYLPWALDSVLRQSAGFGGRGFAILTW